MKVKVATSQFKAIKGDFDANLNKAISLVEKASNENGLDSIETEKISKSEDLESSAEEITQN